MRNNHSDLLDIPTQTLFEALRENWGTLSYHYIRLFKEIRKDVRRGLRKPASGRRYIAGLSEHQEKFLEQLKTRIFD